MNDIFKHIYYLVVLLSHGFLRNLRISKKIQLRVNWKKNFLWMIYCIQETFSSFIIANIFWCLYTKRYHKMHFKKHKVFDIVLYCNCLCCLEVINIWHKLIVLRTRFTEKCLIDCSFIIKVTHVILCCNC